MDTLHRELDTRRLDREAQEVRRLAFEMEHAKNAVLGNAVMTTKGRHPFQARREHESPSPTPKVPVPRRSMIRDYQRWNPQAHTEVFPLPAQRPIEAELVNADQPMLMEMPRPVAPVPLQRMRNPHLACAFAMSLDPPGPREKRKYKQDVARYQADMKKYLAPPTPGSTCSGRSSAPCPGHHSLAYAMPTGLRTVHDMRFNLAEDGERTWSGPKIRMTGYRCRTPPITHCEQGHRRQLIDPEMKGRVALSPHLRRTRSKLHPGGLYEAKS